MPKHASQCGRHVRLGKTSASVIGHKQARSGPGRGRSMTTSGVDILIPVYNAQDTLEQSLRSVAAQTHSSFRVIVIDDGSTDRSGELLDQIARNDPRFLVVHQANAGIVAALNRGLALVDKPYVARMDADDLCKPERLASQVAYLGANPDCIAVGCRVVHIDEHGETIRGLPQPGDPGAADPDWEGTAID